MTKIALTVAAMLVATGTAFADSGSFQQPVNTNHANASVSDNASNVDNTPTASIREQGRTQNGVVKPDITPDPSQRVWGR